METSNRVGIPRYIDYNQAWSITTVDNYHNCVIMISLSTNGEQVVSECQVCGEGSVMNNGYCDLCGTDHMKLLNEYDDWQKKHGLDVVAMHEVELFEDGVEPFDIDNYAIGEW